MRDTRPRTRRATGTTRPTTPAALAALLGVVLLGAACGGEDAAPPPTAASGAAPLGRAAAALTGTPVPTAVPETAGAPTAAAPRTATPAAAARPSASPSPAARGAPAALDPCRLATKQEVEAAAGFALAEGQPRRSAIDVCLYEEPPGRGVVPGRVYLYAMRSAAARAFYDDARVQDSRAMDVPGVGDRAFVGSAGEVTAMRGDVFVQLAVENGPAGQDAAAARARRLALVRTILDRQ